MNVQATGSLQRHVGSLSIIVYGNQTSVYEAWVTQEGQSSGPPTRLLFASSLFRCPASESQQPADQLSEDLGVVKLKFTTQTNTCKNAAAAGCECRWKSTTLFRLELKGKKTQKPSNEENSQSLFPFSFHFLDLLVFCFFFFYCTLFSYSPLSRPLLRNIGEFSLSGFLHIPFKVRHICCLVLHVRGSECM